MTERPDLGVLFGAGETTTFLGLDAVDPNEALSDLRPGDASSVVLGVPVATPYASVGPYARNGPASIRRAAAQWAANIDHWNFDVDGPIFPDGAARALDAGDLSWDAVDFAANRDTIRTAVGSIVATGAVPVLIGGDDSIPIPMLEALAETGRTWTVVQVDAHIDWRDEVQGERFGLSSNMRRASEMDHIGTMIQLGARGIGSARTADVEAAADRGVHLITAADLLRGGMRHAIELIEPGADVALCFDIDGLDPSIAPNTIGRAPGGLLYHHAVELITGIASVARLGAVDFAEICPEMDVDDQGAITVSRLVAATLGVIARQSPPPT